MFYFYLTRLWVFIGVTHSYSSCPFLYTLVHTVGREIFVVENIRDCTIAMYLWNNFWKNFRGRWPHGWCTRNAPSAAMIISGIIFSRYESNHEYSKNFPILQYRYVLARLSKCRWYMYVVIVFQENSPENILHQSQPFLTVQYIRAVRIIMWERSSTKGRRGCHCFTTKECVTPMCSLSWTKTPSQDPSLRTPHQGLPYVCLVGIWHLWFIFATVNQSKTGWWKGLGLRLPCIHSFYMV